MGNVIYSYDFRETFGAMYATNDRNRALELMGAGYRPLIVPQMFGVSDGCYIMIKDGSPAEYTLDDYERSMEDYCSSGSEALTNCNHKSLPFSLTSV